MEDMAARHGHAGGRAGWHGAQLPHGGGNVLRRRQQRQQLHAPPTIRVFRHNDDNRGGRD
jgi:hypothetical protein